jgi:hypothetical protein
MSYKILKDKEQTIEGKPSEIKGLVAHLVYLEKQEQALKTGEPVPSELCEDAEYSDEVFPQTDPGPQPDSMLCTLAELDNQRF